MTDCVEFAFCVNDIEIDLVNQVTNRGYGFQPHRYGSQYWAISLGAPPRTDEQIREIECLKNLHESGAGQPICVYDVRRAKPLSVMQAIEAAENAPPPEVVSDEWLDFNGDIGTPTSEWADFSGAIGDVSTVGDWYEFNGASAGQTASPTGGTVAASSSADGTITIAGLPSGFVLSCGDMLGYTDAEGRCWAHRVVEDVTASGDTVVSVRPRPDETSAGGFEINFDKVHISMILEFTPISASVASGRLNTYAVSGYESVPVF